MAVNKGDKGAKYLKMSVVDSVSKKDVAYEVPEMIGQSATVITDGRRRYSPVEKSGSASPGSYHTQNKEVCDVFPWVHIAISHAKKKTNGIHHHVNNT